MPSHATTSVRVTGIASTVEEHAFADAAKRLGVLVERRGLFSALSSAAASNCMPLTSLCPQFEEKVGTITFPSEKAKQQALRSHGTNWTFDDAFDGVTVLYSSTKPDLDICAVHGLNGNAFDTWSIDNVMWLRDLLPLTRPFDQSRIMTFGYNSKLTDRSSLSGLREWADDLLGRLSSEKERPIILVSYSLGGLVAREAMIRLNSPSHLFDGISLKNCGLLFLSTPHSGSTEADWNRYLVDVAKLAFGVRSNAIVDALRSSNPQSARSREDFRNMSTQPPYDCFYETRATKVIGLNRHIVTLASAGLNGQAAFPIPEADHESVCKFVSKFNGGYRLVVKSLGRLKGILDEEDYTPSRPKPVIGRPPPVAHRIVNPPGKSYYAGKGLRATNRVQKLKGRKSEQLALEDLIMRCQEGAGAVAITGIGGIGKTEMLLETACKRLDQINIFFLQASNEALLQEAYLHIAMHIGPEVLLYKHHGRNTRDIWSNTPPEEKVEVVKDWLSHPDNKDTLVILDDLDGLQRPEVILAAIPQGAKMILFSTRNPNLRGELDRQCYQLRLWPMDTDEIMDVVQATINQSDYEQDGQLHDRNILRHIAKAFHGHPLAASNAVKYIIRVISQQPGGSAQFFLSILENGDYEARRRFLEYKLRSPSIMDTFYMSKSRLREPDGHAWTLMQFLSILEMDDTIVDYRDFFYGNQICVELANFPDHELLANRGTYLSEVFAELESVSFGERIDTSRPLHFHPLWLECTRQAMGAENRLRVIMQVLLICVRMIEFYAGDHAVHKNFSAHIRHCLKVSKSFRINIRQLTLPGNTVEWLERNYLIFL